MATHLFDLLGKVDNLDEPIPPLNRRPVAYGLIISFLTCALACAAARLWVRFRVTKCPWWDDGFVVLSMITGTGLAVAVMDSFNHHSGTHILTYVAEPGAVSEYARSSYVQNAFYPTAVSFIKIAILLQYLRVFQDERRYQQVTVFVLAIVASWGLASGFICWFPSFPTSAIWDFDNTTAIRYGLSSLRPDIFTGVYIAITSVNMALDVVVLAIPVPYYFSSAMSSKSRYSLVALFLLGTCINLIALARLIEIVRTQAGTFPTLDPSFYVTSPMVLSCLEISLSIMAASLPVFWPMLRFDLGSILVTTEVTVTQEHEMGGGASGKGGTGGHGARSSKTPWTWDAKAGRWEARVVPMTAVSGSKKKGYRGAENDEESLIAEPQPTLTTRLKRSVSLRRGRD